LETGKEARASVAGIFVPQAVLVSATLLGENRGGRADAFTEVTARKTLKRRFETRMVDYVSVEVLE